MSNIIKILVIGSDGQLGQSFKSLKDIPNNFKITFSNRSSLDITNKNLLEEFIANNHFDFILNFSAYTDVDNAESSSDVAYNINSLGVENLASVCTRHNIFVIHISTDYVFDGKFNELYNERNTPNPLNIYGRSKLEGENKLQLISSRYMIIRVSWLYSEFKKNFFKTIVRLSEEKNSLDIVNDQIGSPTYAVDFSRDLAKIIQKTHKDFFNKDFEEIFHYANTGSTSWHGFASEILILLGSDIKPNKIFTKSLNLKASRPTNSSLDSTKIQTFFNIKIESWRTSLLNCVINYKSMED